MMLTIFRVVLIVSAFLMLAGMALLVCDLLATWKGD